LPSKVISGSTKVIDFGTNRKRVFDFLLVINIVTFGDTAACCSKIANSYPPHPHSTPSLGVTPWNFGMNLISLKTRMMGLPYGEEIVIVGRTTSVIDRRTDGCTDRITMTKTAQRTQRRAVKTYTNSQ